MTPLQQAARNIILRWDSPLWKYQVHTAEYVNALRVALEAEQAQAVKPIGYIRHADKTFWPHPECAVYASLSPSLAPVYAHPAPPAQAVEPVATVQCINGVTIGYLDVMQPVGTKLYTHPSPPAQQVAVPMTEAQIFECDPVPHVMFDQQRIDFARAIEAFHGIGVKPHAPK